MSLQGFYTTKGLALAAKLAVGTKLTVTKVLAGSGTTAVSASALADIRQTLTVGTAKVAGQTATLPVTLAESGAATSYVLTELGVYAADPDEGEILFQVFRMSEGCAIMADGESVYRFYLKVSIGTSGATVTCSPAGLLIEEDLEPVKVALAQKPDMITGYPIIYVAKTGDDTTGNGSKSKPYLTIQKAVDSLPKCIAGIVTVTVGAGSYDEELLVMHFFGDGAMTIQGADGEQVQIRDVKVRNVNIGKFILKNVELVGTSNDNYKTSFSVDLAGTYVYLEQVTCTQAAETALLGALRFNRGATAFLSDCTISNKPVAIDIVGATVYMNSTVTGENNTVGIRCGSAWGGFGGFMQKGGATIAGEEQKGYGGQIW